MIYMLEFLGLLAVAASLAASPVLVNVIERFFPRLDDEGQTATGYGVSSMAADRTETRDEIRRVTSMLETSNLNMKPASRSSRIDT